MLKIQLNNKEYTVETITAKALKKVVAFKKKYAILQSQGDSEEELISEIVYFLVEVFNKQFTADDVWEYLPLNELNPVINETVDEIMAVLSNETKKK